MTILFISEVSLGNYYLSPGLAGWQFSLRFDQLEALARNQEPEEREVWDYFFPTLSLVVPGLCPSVIVFMMGVLALHASVLTDSESTSLPFQPYCC